jgi:hypothetical protein
MTTQDDGRRITPDEWAECIVAVSVPPSVRPNAVQRVIASVRRDGGSPGAQLTMGLILLRGGSVSEPDLIADIHDWYAEYGTPTEAALDGWADGLGVESDLAETMMRLNAARGGP